MSDLDLSDVDVCRQVGRAVVFVLDNPGARIDEIAEWISRPTEEAQRQLAIGTRDGHVHRTADGRWWPT